MKSVYAWLFGQRARGRWGKAVDLSEKEIVHEFLVGIDGILAKVSGPFLGKNVFVNKKIARGLKRRPL